MLHLVWDQLLARVEPGAEQHEQKDLDIGLTEHELKVRDDGLTEPGQKGAEHAA